MKWNSTNWSYLILNIKRCCLSFETDTHNIRCWYEKPGGVCLVLNYMICWHGTLGLLGLTISHQIIVWFVVKKCATSKHFVLINSKWLI